MVHLRTLAGMLFLAGCSVPVQIESATVNSAKVSRVNGVAEYHLTVRVDKAGWKRVIKNEMYTYIHVVDCRSGALQYAVYPNLGGAPAEDFEAMSIQLEKQSGNEIVLNGTFRAPTEFLKRRHCVTLDGGSYFLQNVRSNRVVVEPVSSAA